MTEEILGQETLCNENNNEISGCEEINKDIELTGEELLEHENEEKEENLEPKGEAAEGEQNFRDAVNGGFKEETNGVNGDHGLPIRGGELDRGCEAENGDKMEEENSKQSEDDHARSDQEMEQKKKNGKVLESDLCKGSKGEGSSLDTRLVEAENGGVAKVCDSMTPDNGIQDKTSEKTSNTGKVANQKSRTIKSSVRRAHPLRGHSSTKLQRSKVTLTSNVSTKSRSSIDIDISRIIRGDTGEAGDSVTMVTTKSVDFSQPMGTDDVVDQELARAVGNDDATSSFSDFPGGRAAATNTPVDSHLQHRSLHTPVKDNIYEHALHLIKNRCRSRTTTVSSRYPLLYPSGVSEYVWDEEEEDTQNAISLPTLLSNIDEAPFNCQPNRTFFIMQRHPIPLEPLKVWKGYHGNVFFQPLICRRMRMSVSEKIPVNAVNASMRKQISTARTGSNIGNTRLPHVNAVNVKHKRATTTKTWSGIGTITPKDGRNVASAATRPVTRQMSVLDRRTVLSQMDQNFGEDITWLNGIEALGALQIGTGRSRSSAHFYDNRVQHYKLRICRGLVSHNLDRLGKENPTLDVSGDKMRETGRDGERHGNRQVGRGYRQSVVKLNSGNRSGTSPPQSHHHTSGNGRHVVVDLTKGSEIVREYLVGGRLNMSLVDENIHENVK